MIEFFKTFLLPIILALISFLGIITPIILNLRAQNKNLRKENKQIKEVAADLSEDVINDLNTFNKIREVVDNILSQTIADRFLILVANNGKQDMRFATAIYEQHKGIDSVVLSFGATNKFINFEIDSQYKEMLKTAERDGRVNLVVDNMPPSDLKFIYNGEKVKNSLIFFLKRMPINSEHDRILYCSIASHSGIFNEEEITLLKSYTSNIKTIMQGI